MDSRHGLRTYPNPLAGLELSRQNHAWVADITHVRLPTCFIYMFVTLYLTLMTEEALRSLERPVLDRMGNRRRALHPMAAIVDICTQQ